MTRNRFLESEFLPATAEMKRRNLVNPFDEPVDEEASERADAILRGVMAPLNQRLVLLVQNFGQGKAMSPALEASFLSDLDTLFGKALAVVELAVPNSADRSAGIRLIREIHWGMRSVRERLSPAERKMISDLLCDKLTVLGWTLNVAIQQKGQ